MKEIKNGVILNGKVYEVRESRVGRGSACARCDLGKECEDYLGSFCYWFEAYLDYLKSSKAIFFKKVKDEKDLHSRQGNG